MANELNRQPEAVRRFFWTLLEDDNKKKGQTWLKKMAEMGAHSAMQELGDQVLDDEFSTDIAEIKRWKIANQAAVFIIK